MGLYRENGKENGNYYSLGITLRVSRSLAAFPAACLDPG